MDFIATAVIVIGGTENCQDILRMTRKALGCASKRTLHFRPGKGSFSKSMKSTIKAQASKTTMFSPRSTLEKP
jgi:hypothetical protein